MNQDPQARRTRVANLSLLALGLVTVVLVAAAMLAPHSDSLGLPGFLGLG